ncbi:phosphate uptake regulator, PhoU [Desulfovibrio sp. X2]|uniref:phosphate signaling complex protein PhoU n=1 Tax=Desulfovibrio sp. X2 TaxID=941449 RepID=UPI000358EA67|nr:phosphate signaling complex protein PhoU [Desulfovibrio sp. X2]EPR41232.1 phosphate uptake regulator, PhoU [Desulfovibrio sp. X2]
MERLHLDKELSSLRLKLLEMSSLCDKALAAALKSAFERDTDLAETVIEGDSEINRLHCTVDEDTLTVLAREQPVARDLRFLLGSTYMAANLERVGDQAVNIAERAVLLNQRPALPHNPLMEELALHVQAMFRKAIQAYNAEDADLAMQVCDMDSHADNLNMKILKHYMDYMIQESRAVERAVHKIIMARCLERVGDQTTNIAENLIFILKGVDIRQTCRP